jgi:hypothetical protein
MLQFFAQRWEQSVASLIVVSIAKLCQSYDDVGTA